MNFGALLHDLPSVARRAVRNIETTSRKIINARASVVFNEQCITNNLLPKFTNIRLNSEAVQRRKFTLDFRRNLVLDQIREKSEDVVRLQEQKRQEQSMYLDLPIPDGLRHRVDEALVQ